MSSREEDEWSFGPDSCDPEFCERCNPVLREAAELAASVREQIKTSQGKTLLAKMLLSSKAGHEVVIKGKLFSLRDYIDDGYDVGKDVNVTFVKEKQRHGVLHDKNGNVWIYHDGTIPAESKSCEVFPQVCQYMFLRTGRDGKAGPDVDAVTHVKILFQDVVFEDYVHDGHGVIIENKHLSDMLLLAPQAISNSSLPSKRKLN